MILAESPWLGKYRWLEDFNNTGLYILVTEGLVQDIQVVYISEANSFDDPPGFSVADSTGQHVLLPPTRDYSRLAEILGGYFSNLHN